MSFLFLTYDPMDQQSSMTRLLVTLVATILVVGGVGYAVVGTKVDALDQRMSMLEKKVATNGSAPANEASAKK